MKLICDSEMAGVGLPVFRPEGAWMKNKLREYLRRKLQVSGYQEVESPAIGNLEMFKQSGHYPYYKDNMFPVLEEYESSLEKYMEVAEAWVLKPMNCPFHIALYKDEPRSYRNLPLRYCEFGKVYRYEESGAVNGLLRSRAFEQDDGHIFCDEFQIHSEIAAIIQLSKQIFAEFQINPIAKVSVRGEQNKDKYFGGDLLWNHAQHVLASVLDDEDIPYEVQDDAAAFYGPKIDFVVKDKLGREWQLGTIQLDFNLPQQFGLEFRNQLNQQEKPVLIHRAILGSLERFIGYLVSEDKIPDFIHPKLFAIVPVSNEDRFLERAKRISELLYRTGHSNKTFDRDEPLKAKIARAKEEGYRKVAVFGQKEIEMDDVQVTIDGRTSRVYLL